MSVQSGSGRTTCGELFVFASGSGSVNGGAVDIISGAGAAGVGSDVFISIGQGAVASGSVNIVSGSSSSTGGSVNINGGAGVVADAAGGVAMEPAEVIFTSTVVLAVVFPAATFLFRPVQALPPRLDRSMLLLVQAPVGL